jgi:hypothetical protein
VLSEGGRDGEALELSGTWNAAGPAYAYAGPALPPQSIFWETPNVQGEAPCPRSGHSFTVLGERFILFGGCGRKDGASA